jgi:hypothetical protein
MSRSLYTFSIAGGTAGQRLLDGCAALAARCADQAVEPLVTRSGRAFDPGTAIYGRAVRQEAAIRNLTQLALAYALNKPRSLMFFRTVLSGAIHVELAPWIQRNHPRLIQWWDDFIWTGVGWVDESRRDLLRLLPRPRRSSLVRTAQNAGGEPHDTLAFFDALFDGLDQHRRTRDPLIIIADSVGAA